MDFANGEKRPIWAFAKTGFDRTSKDSRLDRFCPEGDEDRHECLTLCNILRPWRYLEISPSNTTIPVNDWNQHQHIPLHMAAISNNVNATNALLSKGGAELDCRDCLGDTPLSIAAYHMHRHVAILWVEAHAELDINFVDRSLQASVFESIELSNVGAVPVLIDKGVDVLARNEMGEMALQITQRRKYGEIERILGESARFFRIANEDNGVKRKNDSEVKYTASPRQKPRLEH